MKLGRFNECAQELVKILKDFQLQHENNAFSLWVCMAFTSLTYIPKDTTWFNCKVILESDESLLANPLFADRTHLRVKYKQIDNACYRNIHVIWVHEWGII